jgi:DNA ligase-1
MAFTALPTLYKKTSTGAAQQWSVRVYEKGSEVVIESTYGQVDGALQTATEIIREGKNIGRANETTILEQAQSQAASLWEKKRDKGYIEELSKIDSGGKNADVRPMLAKPFEDREDKLTIGMPIFLQPKLDGIRCIAKKEKDKVGLFSRNGKVITAVPHIVQELIEVMNNGEIWDGELYHPELEFNEITALTRTKEPVLELVDEPVPEEQRDPNIDYTPYRSGLSSSMIEYHIFDMISDEPFVKRSLHIHHKIIGNHKTATPMHIKVVETIETEYDRTTLDNFHRDWTKKGYEGVIIRLKTQKGYEQKRTSSLIKYKKFLDDEFKIVGYETGTPGSKLDQCLGAFWLKIDAAMASYRLEDGTGYFKAKPDGSLELSKKLWDQREQWLGKMVKIKFQNYSEYGIPRFPIVVGIRWEGDM